ncbi:ABC transporter ATP-binding protein [Nocardia mexicana]|uniref:Peptide/nickel transport system ATP-binding protein n=1 Tax=Nocardia mexicana TaxID=279262 RepID=A0A370H273_9NOCA|nr:ATP-binding cassette domain-containing protein [Nocardia mexicana]RDI50110.1 peptide/nickel transport system ATP-binding protein [Nocardia mexicana]
MSEGAAPVVSVRGLSVRAGAAVLVEDVDFDVHAGRILTLFGPSGAGKTTIASALAAVDRPGITVTGEIRRGSGEDGIRIGYLPQNAAATLNPARRIGAALGELADLHHRRNGRRRDARGHRLAHVAQSLSAAAFDVDALDRVLRKFPHEFSGGERARLALAQVLSRDPDVLVVDEPTVGLDSLARAELLDSLTGLRRAGTAVVLVTHDEHAVHQLSDHTLYVHAGRLVDDRAHLQSDDDERPHITDGPTRTFPQLSRDGVLRADKLTQQPNDGPLVQSSASRISGEPVLGEVPSTHAGEGEPALRLSDVAVTLGGSPVLREIDLEVRDGELLGVSGVSGAGKSTIARCIAGLVAPGNGEVVVDGVRIPLLRKRSRAQIAAVQYVWQESAASFDSARTVVDQVAATGVRLRGLDRASARAAALQLLDELGIGADQAIRYPPGLSGGQLQRAALARALLARPRVLVCDEITTALDRPLAQRILDHVDHYRRSTGAAVLSISHDLRGQLDRADRLAIVDRGRIAEIGTPKDLLAHPETAILRRLLEAEQLPPARPREVDGSASVVADRRADAAVLLDRRE